MTELTELNVDSVEWYRVDDASQIRVREWALWRSRGVVPVVSDGSEAGRKGDRNSRALLASAAEMRLKSGEESWVVPGRAFQL